MIKQLFLILLVFLFSVEVHAQFTFEYDNSLEVIIGADTLEHAWDGGLNYTQFSDIDFDQDGDLDLLLFDRSNNQLRIYRKDVIGDEFSYHLEYNVRNQFPDDIRYRLTTVDYDNDGDKDLFTYGIGGIKVYKNISTIAAGLQFQLFKNILQSQYSGGTSNLYVSSSDIPAIIDVDNDGDIDVLTFNNGGKRIEYHQNQSVELYGVQDSMVFELKNECWGKFEENSTDNSIILSPNTAPCNGNTWVDDPAKSGKHTGSTILALDEDNSGVLDLILGDVSHENLILVTNGGTAVNQDSPMVSVDDNFPNYTTPAHLFVFPASFYVDVSNDGVKDLIVGANAKGVSRNTKSVMYYENLGTDNNPMFTYKTNAFLQEEMIENGTGAIPIITDIDNDGLEDMLVANFFRYKDTLQKETTVQYYKNIGTDFLPRFRLISNDWNNFKTAGIGLRVVPTFGDLNGDGKKDMLIGTETGKIHYYQNNSPTGEDDYAAPIFNITDNLGEEINYFTYVSPQLFDLNKDGLLDLVIGKKTGEIVYYKNIGTATDYSFELVTENLGAVNVGAGSSDAFCVPHFINKNDTVFLFCGAKNGNIWFYDDIDENLEDGDSFNLNTATYLNISKKGYSAPFISDLDADGNLNLLVGGDLGGVWHFESDPLSSIGLEEDKLEFNFNVYPNPTNGEFKLELERYASNLKMRIIDLNGRLVLEKNNLNQVNAFNLSAKDAGIYLIMVLNENNQVVGIKKVIKN